MEHVIGHAYHIASLQDVTDSGIDLGEMGIGDFVFAMPEDNELSVGGVKAHVLNLAVCHGGEQDTLSCKITAVMKELFTRLGVLLSAECQRWRNIGFLILKRHGIATLGKE